MPGVNAVADTC